MTKSWLSLLAIGAVAVEQVAAAAAAAEPRVVKMPMGRVATSERPLRKRASPQSVQLGNAAAYYLYYVNATVGTPGQPVSFQIDTGSSDLWMFGPQVCQSQEGQQLCQTGGYFNPEDSKTYVPVGKPGEFQIQYVTPGSGVSGNYFEDDFALGSIKLTNLTMAVASNASAVTIGIMGIGYDTDESLVQTEGEIYPNIIDVMYNESVIASHSYSLYLDDLEASTGAVLFGGYDTAKYTGPLTVLDIQTDAQTDTIDTFSVVWSFIGVTDSSTTGTTLLNTGDFPMPAVLDSGTSLTVIPQDIFDQLASYFNASYEGPNIGYLVPCSIADNAGTVDYGFGGDGGAVIQVPFSELALPATDNQGNPLTFSDGTAACSFGLDVVSQGSPILLGDTFLRSAYVIYDLDANQIGLAQAKYNVTDSNIKEIPYGTDLASILGSAATVATGATASQTASGQLPAGGGAHATGSSIATGSAAAGGPFTDSAKTTINFATTVTSNPQATGGSSSTSSGAAYHAAPVPIATTGVLTVCATFLALFASGAAMMAFF